MAKNIHPKLTEVTVTCSNGKIFKTQWTLSEKAITLHNDPFTNPAWTGEFKLDTTTGRAAAFLGRFNKN